MTQYERILKYLDEHGSITRAETVRFARYWRVSDGE